MSLLQPLQLTQARRDLLRGLPNRADALVVADGAAQVASEFVEVGSVCHA